MKEIKILGLEKKQISKKYKVVTSEDDYNFSEDMIIKYHIFKDAVFTKKEFDKILEDSLKDDYFNKVLNYIGASPKSVYEIEKYIHDKERKSKQYLKEYQIQEIIDRVEKLGYLNDEELCNNVLDYYIRNNKGPLFIKNKLIEKRIDENLIEEVLQKYTYDIESDVIDRVISKEKNNGYTVKKFKINLTNKLIRNGFTSSLVYSKVDKLEVEDNNEELIEKDFSKIYYKVMKKDISDYDRKQLILANLLSKGYEYREINDIIKEKMK